ncbi:MAG: hypothetical protein PHD81_04665 [Candidatus Nanoarchaeia archaeon]|nr:hypothetical protein [Candidatus Nanoarchaeia archaeon]MDD5588369.1 hypothetical protein [Candidatus Nanoarchaeia archaeon]
MSEEISIIIAICIAFFNFGALLFGRTFLNEETNKILKYVNILRNIGLLKETEDIKR